MGEKKLARIEKPSIYQFHDIREFLNQWFDYLKAKDRSFNVRSLASSAGVSKTQLYAALSGKKIITQKMYIKIKEHLGLTKHEVVYLGYLRDLCETDSQEVRVDAYKKISRLSKYKGAHKDSINQHEYLARWYIPAIRELARLKGFSEDPRWIQKRLKKPTSLTEIRGALRFLFKNDYLRKDENGKVSLSQPENIHCASGVFRLAMSEYHEQTLEIARDSIYQTERDYRDLKVHTVALQESKISDVKGILAEAIQKIQNIQHDEDELDSVYQMSLLAFPLATDSDGDK